MINTANNENIVTFLRAKSPISSRILYLVLFLFILMFTFFIITTNTQKDIEEDNKSTKITLRKESLTTSTHITNLTPTPKNEFFKIPTLSSDPTFYAYIKTDTQDSGSQEIQLIISTSEELRVMQEGRQIQFIYKGVVPNNYADYFENLNTQSKKIIAWSRDNNRLAFLIPHKVLFYNLKWSTVNETGWDGSERGVRTVEVSSLKQADVSAEVEQIFFSGDGSELYLGNQEIIDTNTGQMTKLEGQVSNSYYSGGKVFPIPNSKGVTYWESNIPKGLSYIVKNIQGNITKYQLPEGTYDYKGSIISLRGFPRSLLRVL